MQEIRLLRANEIECRVGQCGVYNNGNGWCSLLLYKDARCDMKMMDEVFGVMNWKKSYELINGNLFCTVSVLNEKGEWVSKQDVGVESNTEKEKGQASDAFKRSCVNWGIGRELYTAPKIFINNLKKDEEIKMVNGKPKVAAKCVFVVAEIGYDKERNINALTIVDGNGVVRYKLGEHVQQPQQSNQKENGDDISEQLNGYALPSISQAQTRDELNRIWNDFPMLQDEQRFIDAINERLNKIEA